MQRRVAHAVAVLAVVAALVGGVHAESTIPAEERDAVKARVEAIEAQFRRIRDEKLVQCRGAWTLCTNKRCKKIEISDADRWQTCQDECDAEYDRCKRTAYEIWSEDD